MNIKGKEIGTDRPLVCVPIVEKAGEAVLEEAKRLEQQPADMVEWRIDWYEDSDSLDAVCHMMKELAEVLKNKILLATFRSEAQGGEKKITSEAYMKMLEAIAEQGNADMLDVEVCELEKPKSFVHKLQSMGAVITASDHDFVKTPATEIMVEKLLYMRSLGADVAKLAVMPKNREDVARLLTATARVKECFPKYPVITMSMGAYGMISRLAGQSFGSCVTFAAAGKTSAPGQMPLEDVVMILNRISESMEK